MAQPVVPLDDAHVPLVEACCDSVQSARASQAYGAGRIELCGPGDGGTTPSLGLIARCRDAVQVPVHVMIRPHTHSFVYLDDDVDVMCHDIDAAKALGVDGIVLGPLNSDHTVQRQQLAAFIALARPMRVGFHRAFDRSPDAHTALELLIALGVDLVLTAGHAPSALEGAGTLRDMQQRAGGKITILAGGGIRSGNVGELIRRTAVTQVHARATDPMIVRDVILALMRSDERSLAQSA